MTAIHLVRHGLVDNPNHILYGRLPNFRLDPVGEQQAAAAGHYLSKFQISSIYHSPLLRTTHTAEIIAQTLGNGTPRRAAEAVTEVNTYWEGRPLHELEAIGWDMYKGAGPEYDQPEDLIGRSQPFLAELAQKHAGEHIVVVSHGDVIVFNILWAMGIEVNAINKNRLNEYGFPTPYIDTASISTLSFDGPFLPGQILVNYTVPHST